MLPTRIPVSMGMASRSMSEERNKRGGLPLTAAIAVVAVLAARAAESEAVATMYATLAVFGVMFILMTLVTLRWSSPQTVSVVVRDGGALFSPPVVPLVLTSLVTGLVMLSIARLWAEPEQWNQLPFYERSAFVVFPLLGAYMTGEALWALRRSAGLSVDERGMRGVRGGPGLDLKWSDVIDVKVAESKKQRSLVLVLATGRDIVRIPERAVGGDLYAVATIVNYYLQNPDERGRLVDGLDAVRHVDSEVRAGRFSRI